MQHLFWVLLLYLGPVLFAKLFLISIDLREFRLLILHRLFSAGLISRVVCTPSLGVAGHFLSALFLVVNDVGLNALLEVGASAVCSSEGSGFIQMAAIDHCVEGTNHALVLRLVRFFHRFPVQQRGFLARAGRIPVGNRPIPVCALVDIWPLRPSGAIE